MLYPICPTCGALLLNIQLPYEHEMEQLCEKYNITLNALSHNTNISIDCILDKQTIIDKYTDKDRYCCRMRLGNFIKLVELIK
jgi:hypothetical protein